MAAPTAMATAVRLPVPAQAIKVGASVAAKPAQMKYMVDESVGTKNTGIAHRLRPAMNSNRDREDREAAVAEVIGRSGDRRLPTYAPRTIGSAMRGTRGIMTRARGAI